MKFKLIAITMAAAAAIVGRPADAALVISEVLANEVGSDVTGEFIELYNNGLLPIDLSDYKIGDEEASGGTSATESIHKFPAGVSIAPGEVLVIAVGATRFNTVYGFMPDYEVNATELGVPDMLPYATWDPDGGVMNYSNTNDQAVILDAADALVDAVSWGNNFAFNPGIDVATTPTVDGQSFERINVLVDTNTRDDWQYGPGAGAAATRSTPGVVSLVPEPSSALLMALASTLGIALRRKLTTFPTSRRE